MSDTSERLMVSVDEMREISALLLQGKAIERARIRAMLRSEEVAGRMEGALTSYKAPIPGGKVYPGRAQIDHMVDAALSAIEGLIGE